MRPYLKYIVLILITALIFWYVGRNLDWAEVSDSLKRADKWYLFAAVLIICAGYLLRAIRWQVLLSPITKAGLRELFATTTVGFAAIFLIGRAGEILRPMWLPMLDKRVRPSAALVTIGMERLFDLTSLIAFFSISLIWFQLRTGHEAEYAYIRLVGNLLLAGAAGFIIFLLIYKWKAQPIIAWFERITAGRFMPSRIRLTLISLMRQLERSLEILKNGRALFWTTFWTISLWFAISLPTYLVLLAFGMPLNFVDSIFVMGVAAMGSLVPTPGGAAGAFHAATAGSLLLLGIDRETAFAASILMHLVYFAPAVVFGLYYLFHGEISIERFRSLLSREHAVEEIESDSPDFESEDLKN
ncbi:MAG: flippase-like domain-containing protein [Acidobacteria bacterium]|nr:flippase-like domain-containing protein [Acidobacteriota bacterium]